MHIIIAVLNVLRSETIQNKHYRGVITFTHEENRIQELKHILKLRLLYMLFRFSHIHRHIFEQLHVFEPNIWYENTCVLVL